MDPRRAAMITIGVLCLALTPFLALIGIAWHALWVGMDVVAICGAVLLVWGIRLKGKGTLTCMGCGYKLEPTA